MTDQPANLYDTSKIGQSATRAHIIVAVRKLIDDPADLTVVDGGPITRPQVRPDDRDHHPRRHRPPVAGPGPPAPAGAGPFPRNETHAAP